MPCINVVAGFGSVSAVIRVYAEKYIALGEDFRELEHIAYMGGSKGADVAVEAWKNVATDELKELVSLFMRVERDCKQIGLKVCGKIAEQINKDFSDIETLTWSIAGPRIDELKRCFMAELEETKCYVILPGRESFYTDDPLVFVVKETVAKFPSIKFDITEAGKCFATERFTACVSHLVKVAEYAFVSFVRYAKLPKEMEDNWNKGLNAIHENIKNKKAPFDHLSDGDEEYFVGLEGYLRTFKTAWRNPASHIPIIFLEPQARSIFEIVKTLMDSAAQRLSESQAASQP